MDATQKSDDSPSVYERDGITIYRASDLGGCITRLAAARQGQQKVEPKGFQQTIFDAGNTAEDIFFDYYPEWGHYRQMEVVLHITPKIAVVGHLDAYCDRMLELKSQSDEEYQKWTWDAWTEDPLWIKYSWQVSACMLALGHEPATLARMNRKGMSDGSGILMDFQAIHEPFWTLEDIIARIMEVEALATEDTLRCTTPDFFCSYPYLHVDDKEVVDDGELEELVTIYLSAKANLAESQLYLDSVKRDITEHLDGKGYKKVLLMSGRSVSRSEYDTKDHMVKGSHQVRLTIK